MGTSSTFLCTLFFCGALECQDDKACGISIGTSEQSEISQQKGCLPRAQCLLLGHATYWPHSYTLQHHCCDQDPCNTATSLQQPCSSLLPPCSSWPASPGEATSSTSLTRICSPQPRSPPPSPRPWKHLPRHF